MVRQNTERKIHHINYLETTKKHETQFEIKNYNNSQ